MKKQYLHFLFNSCGNTLDHCLGSSIGSIGCSGCSGGATNCAGGCAVAPVNCAGGCAGKK
jgi:hypothetical protein